MYISTIGIHNGDMITSSPSGIQCRGTILQVFGDNDVLYPPYVGWISGLSPNSIRDELNHYSAYSNIEDRLTYLQSISTTNDDLYLSDISNLRIKFIKIGVINDGKKKPIFSPEELTRFAAGNPDREDGTWDLSYIYHLIPRTSTARRHSLLFRPTNWVVMPSTILSVPKSGPTINLESGELEDSSNNLRRYSLSDEISVSIPFSRPLLTPKEMDTIAISFSEVDENDYIKMKKIMVPLDPSLHKSLIQKIIRVRPTKISFDGQVYSPGGVLLASFVTLYCHPGSFVPNLQTFVSGREGALKRGAISIIEDSSIENPLILLHLLASAWVCKYAMELRVEFTPSENHFFQWCQALLNAVSSPYMYSYTTHHHSMDNALKERKRLPMDIWYAQYLCLEQLHSFETDLHMVFTNRGSFRTSHDSFDLNTQHRIMPFLHCIDHHNYTEIAYFIRSPITSYSELFRNIWNECSGSNPRREINYCLRVMETPPINHETFLQDIRNAQEQVWVCKYGKRDFQDDLSSEMYSFTYTLSPSWIASLVGPYECRIGSTTAIVVIRPDNIGFFNAIKKPTSAASEANPFLSEEEKRQSISVFKNALERGIKINDSPFPDLIGVMVQYLEDEYHLIFSTYTLSWDEYRVHQGTIPYLNSSKVMNVDFPLVDKWFRLSQTQQNRTGVEFDIRNKLQRWMQSLSLDVYRRLRMYLEGYATTLRPYKIGRDGMGTEYAVDVSDTMVFSTLLYICEIAPSALRRKNFQFEVINKPFFWHLRDIMFEHPHRQMETPWRTVPLPEKRHLWEHQLDSIRQLIHKSTRGQILWINPGLGKTAIVISYICHRISNQTMSKYCVYTLPPSAYETVVSEIIHRGLPYVHLDPRGKKKIEINKQVINIIFHDHVRLIMDQLRPIASSTLLVVDEFHKCLSSTTLRTSNILELAKLSNDFVCLSGTIIKNKGNVNEIIAWLQCVADFEVTVDNYFVAISSLISRRLETKIAVNRIVIPAVFSSEESNEYYSKVPAKLGGSALEIDFIGALNICYEACYREMYLQIKKCWNQKEGVFVVMRNRYDLDKMETKLRNEGITTFSITTSNPISLTPSSPDPFSRGSTTPQIVFTIPTHSEGYSLTRFKIMITSVYFTNEATRQQLEARINRLDQTSPSIEIITVHLGLLSYVHERYTQFRSFSKALEGFAELI